MTSGINTLGTSCIMRLLIEYRIFSFKRTLSNKHPLWDKGLKKSIPQFLSGKILQILNFVSVSWLIKYGVILVLCLFPLRFILFYCIENILKLNITSKRNHFKLLVYSGWLLLTSILPIRIYGIDFQFSRYNPNMLGRCIWYEIYWKQLRTQHLTISSWVYFISLKKAYIQRARVPSWSN